MARIAREADVVVEIGELDAAGDHPRRSIGVADPEGVALKVLAVAAGEQLKRRALEQGQAARAQVLKARAGLLEHVVKERHRALVEGAAAAMRSTWSAIGEPCRVS